MLPVQSVRKINLVDGGVNGIREKSLCKFVDDCGKNERKNTEETRDGRKICIARQRLFDFSDAAGGGKFLELERVMAGDDAVG